MNVSIYLQDILHLAAQDLMVPTMILLIAVIVYALWSIGSLLVERFGEYRYFQANMPETVNDIHEASYGDVARVVAESPLLFTQKRPLIMAANNMGLSEDELFALAKSEISRYDESYRATVARSELIAKVAPMLGLMCTLIPLGPGIVAMGQGDVNQLSTSLLIAFDGTVAGLVGAVIALFAARTRRKWYGRYLMALETLMTCILQRAAEAREGGLMLPAGFTDADLIAFWKRYRDDLGVAEGSALAKKWDRRLARLARDISREATRRMKRQTLFGLATSHKGRDGKTARDGGPPVGTSEVKRPIGFVPELPASADRKPATLASEQTMRANRGE